ncbi:hypothetical protein BDV28DRAFT_22315 [Aspergillus coremiiformis]|uniref:BTB domain-containing protein n=1 Tax=Aspergillus coremiiformis TaxID=138285 RepID=A0A5N6Z0V6_9EURO|nr:hypothetical protein BDV28DRAFT_22315 [Aspergillus coremiiformis]
MTRTLSGGMAQFIVGSTQTAFTVHTELLCNCSPYFKQRLTNQHAPTTTMPLINLQAISPDICPEIFTEFLRWMYLGILFDDVDITNKMFLPKLWVLAETFQISELQHAVVSLYRGITNEAREAVIIEPPAIDYIYAHTPANSSLRLLAVETWARHATTAEFSMHRGGLPRPFLGDLCCALIAGRSEVDSFHDELVSSGNSCSSVWLW